MLAGGDPPGGPAAAAEIERIRDYRSEITAHADATMTVTETIALVASGKKIKRGIYRDFPTTYTDTHGNAVRVGFDVVEVLRDGSPEPSHTESHGNGVRVYIGDKDVFLAPDHYAYTITYRTITYRTNRQLGFFGDFDELYWNVTGNDWDFVIEHAKADVYLPPGAEVLSTTAFTGREGESGVDFTTSRGANRSIVFDSTRPLVSGEGLTIVVSWPKGFVAAPTAAEDAAYLVRDNASVLAGLIGLVVVAAYYLLAWFKVGRDPEAGVIVPLFAPPEDFSPAAVRFIIGMGYDKKEFTAAVVNMAVKGFLAIRGDDGDFVLERNHGDTSALSAGEKKLAAKLFGVSNSIVLKQANHQGIGKAIKAIKALKTHLRAEFEKIHFLRNRQYFTPGVVLTVLTLGAVAAGARAPEEAAFMVVWLGVWTGGCYFLVFTAVNAWRSRQRAGALFMTLFALPFLGGGGGG